MAAEGSGIGQGSTTGDETQAETVADSTVEQSAISSPVAGAVPVPTRHLSWFADPRHRLATGAASLAGVLVIVLILVLASGGGSPTRAVVHTASTSTTTTLSPAAIKAAADYKDYVGRIENIVQQSAAGRGQVGALVTGVDNGCQVSPSDASAQIRTVIDNRTSVLNQLAALPAAPNSEAQGFYSLLQQALQSSLNADTQYKAWMDYLYTDYYYTTPIGCPNGNAPHNQSFDSARSADVNSTSLKNQFTTAFNPVAARLGFPAVDPSGF